jgi:glycine cleavage system P protein (glycine dehydrogenase) subunit 1
MLVAGLPADVQAAAGARYHETVLSFADHARRTRFLEAARARDIFAGIPLEQLGDTFEPRHLLVATTEMIEEDDIRAYLDALEASR